MGSGEPKVGDFKINNDILFQWDGTKWEPVEPDSERLLSANEIKAQYLAPGQMPSGLTRPQEVFLTWTMLLALAAVVTMMVIALGIWIF